MIRRILAIGLAGAAMYAATLGAAAPGQEPVPTGSPEGTPSAAPSASTPVQTAPVQAPTQAPPAQDEAQAPAGSATASPESSPASTGSPTPFASPVETTVASPSPAAGDATATATPETQLEEGGPTDGKPNRKHGKAGNTSDSQRVEIRDCSSSTLGSGCRDSSEDETKKQRRLTPAPRLRNSNGTPAPSNPSYSLAMPGPAPIGVPNFFIDKFRIPPFLLSIYQAAGMQYGIRWEILAAINEIETDYGRNLNISSAGALGWMQFMPPTWRMYGVDANRDGVKDPFNPVDAIFAAARYLRAAGAETDIRRAVFAYNHADWYVDSVLLRAQVIGGMPTDLVGSLTGLTQARFPLPAKATYAGQLTRSQSQRKVRQGTNAAMVVESDGERRGIEIFSRKGAPVVAVNDGRVVKLGTNARLGRFVRLLDVYGNTYTYGHLKSIPKTYPAPKARTAKRGERSREAALPLDDARPTGAASATRAPARERRPAPPRRRSASPRAAAPATVSTRQRLFAHPERPNARRAGGKVQLAETQAAPARAISAPLGFNKRDFVAKPLVKGARVIGGTTLGRIGRTSADRAPHVLFEIRPAGRGAPRIDPKPILDGWKLLESTAVYRAAGKNPLLGSGAGEPSIGQILLLSKEALTRRVLANPRIEIYGCGQNDIRTGQIDRRVLATLELLAASGLKPTVSSLRCGHGYLTAGGNVSEHSTGSAVDIAAVNGIPIVGHQGPGSITDLTIQRLLTLQGTMKAHQIISLMTFEGADNTYAMGDHDDHIHVGWRPLYGTSTKAARQIDAILKPRQWIKLIDRIDSIDNPTVREQPSKFAVKVVKPASPAHRGE